jgi:hypothetical protein
MTTILLILLTIYTILGATLAFWLSSEILLFTWGRFILLLLIGGPVIWLMTICAYLFSGRDDRSA